MDPLVEILPSVAAALEAGQPVVALESTVIAHGLPQPDNLTLALQLHDDVRASGAEPALIAVMDGRLKVGLSDDDVERLATADTVRKLSTRDIPIAITTGEIGATTVASTMYAAALVGIPVFATGGIGGVHRGGGESFDESADLPAIANFPVAVVTAGAKSILDLPKTLERLETLGVPVIGYGTDTFPAFYLESSGLPVDHRFDEVADIAAMLRTKWQLGLTGGAVIANPIPAAAALDKATHDAALDQALKDTKQRGISGKDTTPALLAAIREATGNASLEANIALIRNNATLAAKLAVALAT
ncbi:MAG: pseudouridine-5'-phosphate glycosidase [Alphaproteobacteria bacterium]|nr:pseudouridine-5'-phosphate glycosidase [Alphaproteobacteria bacterium SS10]